jgi:hypothetical protein
MEPFDRARALLRYDHRAGAVERVVEEIIHARGEAARDYWRRVLLAIRALG